MPDKINPYIAGAPVLEKRMFFGREDVFSWIERSLSGKFVDHILVIHGQRRVGKTTVLKHLPDRLTDRYIPIFIDLQGRTNTTLPRFLWWLSREITRALDMQKPDRAAFEDDPEYFESIFLPKVEEALGDNVLLLTFDEFDTLESTSAQEGLALPFMAILKRLMDHRKLNFIFSIGSSGRKLENMQSAYTNFFKQALYRKISFLDESDARDLITRPVEGVLAFDLDAVDRIYEITSGHPYFVQLICHELFSVSQNSDDWQVSKADVDAVLDAVIERGTVNLKFVWDEASELEKWVLAALAQFDKVVDLSQLEQFLKKQKVRFIHQDLESAVLHLREKDVLASGNRFVIYLMKLWLIQNRSIEQVKEELARVNPIVSRLLQVGHEYLDQNELQKAIDAFSEALQSEEDNLEVRLGLAVAYMAREDYGRAAIEYEEILALYPEDVAAQSGYCDANLALGDVRFTMGRLDEAEYAYQQVLKASPQHRDGRARLAKLYHHRAVSAISANVETALEQARSALDLSPGDTDMQAVVHELEALAAGEADIKHVLLSWGKRAKEKENWQDAFDLLSSYQRLEEDESIADIIATLQEKARDESLTSLKQQAERLKRLDAYDDAIFTYTQYLSLDPEDAGAVQSEIQSLKAARKQALREEGRDVSLPIWKRPLAWVSFAVVAVLAGLLAIPTSPLRVALAPPAPTQEVVERVVVATSVPTLAPTPTPEPLPYKWTRITSAQFLERDRVTALAIHPEDADVMYAGMFRSGMYKTIDGGISWFPIQDGFTRGWIQEIIISPDDPDVVYASAIYGGVYKTENGGENWQRLETGADGYWQTTSGIFLNPDNPAHILHTSGWWIKESVDHGQTWRTIEFFYNLTLADGTTPEVWGSIVNDVIYDPSTGNYLAMVDYFETATKHIFVSVDQGESWQEVFEPIREGGTNTILYDTASRSLVLVRADTVEIYVSTDGGFTWAKTANELCESCIITPDGTLYESNWNFIRYSSDLGKTWTQYSSPAREVLHNIKVAVAESNPNRIIMGGEELILSDDGGASWEPRGNGLGAGLTSIGFGDQTNAIYISRLGQDLGKSNTYYQFELADNSYTFLADSTCTPNLTNDWELSICNGYRSTTESGVEFFIDENLGFEFLDRFYRSQSGELFMSNGPTFRKSRNEGQSWIDCSALLGWINGNIKSGIALHPTDANIIFYASLESGLQVSVDGCQSAIETYGLDTDYVNSVTIHPTRPETVYAATDAGVYLSTDGGVHWDPINDGLLGALVVYEVAVDPDNPDDVYAISSYGLFKLEEK